VDVGLLSCIAASDIIEMVIEQNSNIQKFGSIFDSHRTHEHFRFWGSNVKGQGHGGMQYAVNSATGVARILC